MKQQDWSVRMADATLARWPALPPAWSHEYGVLFKALMAVARSTGTTRYADYVQQHVDAVVDQRGHIRGYEREHYSLDELNSGRLLFELFDRTGQSHYLNAAATLRLQLDTHPRTRSGGFWHKAKYPNQMFLDGIYMGAPFYAEYAIRKGDAAALDDAVSQVLMPRANQRDDETGLYFHGWDESREQFWANPQTGCSASFWNRATGWYAMAIVDVLELLPSNYPRRQALIDLLGDLMKALLGVQDEKTGLWWQVLDQGPREGNYLEASGSCMIIYALAKGARLRYLQDEAFHVAAHRAMDGAVRHLVTSEGSMASIRDVCKTAGLGDTPRRDGSFDYYISEPRVADDYKGVAAFMLAADEVEQLARDWAVAPV